MTLISPHSKIPTCLRHLQFTLHALTSEYQSETSVSMTAGGFELDFGCRRRRWGVQCDPSTSSVINDRMFNTSAPCTYLCFERGLHTNKATWWKEKKRKAPPTDETTGVTLKLRRPLSMLWMQITAFTWRRVKDGGDGGKWEIREEG